MNIGEVAKRSGLPAKTIRFYEDIGLVEPQARRANGYRDFDQRDLHELRFVARARSLGFGKREIGTDKVRDLLRDALCAD